MAGPPARAACRWTAAAAQRSARAAGSSMPGRCEFPEFAIRRVSNAASRSASEAISTSRSTTIASSWTMASSSCFFVGTLALDHAEIVLSIPEADVTPGVNAYA